MEYVSLPEAVMQVKSYLTGSKALQMAQVQHENRDISNIAIARYLVINPGNLSLFANRSGVLEKVSPVTLTGKYDIDGKQITASAIINENLRQLESSDKIIARDLSVEKVDFAAEAQKKIECFEDAEQMDTWVE